MEEEVKQLRLQFENNKKDSILWRRNANVRRFDFLVCLIIAVPGEALDVLQGLPENYKDFARVVGYLVMRYGEKHLQHVYQTQL